MKQKKKRKQKVNNDKFNFDDEYIIGFSDSATVTKSNKNNKKSSKKNNKKKVSASKKKENKKAPTSAKIKSKKKKMVSKLLKIFLVLALFVGAGCFLCLSPNFNVQEIEVENNSVISSDTIISLSKIEMFKNIFLIDKSDAIQNIEKEPYINSVKISRMFPNKIKITVEERTEKYLLEFAEGKYAVLDGQGYILRITNTLIDLPIIVGTKTDLNSIIEINDNQTRLCEEDLKKLDIVASIIDTAKNYEVDTYITKIDIGDITDVKLVLESEQKTVYLGSCSDLNTRILYMKDILNREKGIKGELFINGNLSEDRVFFRESVN